MAHDFSQLKRNALVAVRRQFPAGIQLQGENYWFFAGKVQQRHQNGLLTVVFDDLTGKQVVVRFDRQGYPIGPDGTVKHQDYEIYGGLLVPLTPEIERIFRHQKVLSAIWKLTWPDLMLLQDYELDYIYALLQEAHTRGVAGKRAVDREDQTQTGGVLQPETHHWILCSKGDGFDLVKDFPYRSDGWVGVQTRSVTHENLPWAACLICFTFDQGNFSDEQLAFLRTFLRRSVVFDVSASLMSLCPPGSLKGREG
jgi:hypothetical protein